MNTFNYNLYFQKCTLFYVDSEHQKGIEKLRVDTVKVGTSVQICNVTQGRYIGTNM